MSYVSTSGATRLKCFKCQAITTIPGVELNFVELTRDDNNPAKTGYQAATYRPCKQCGSEVGAVYTVWESREGQIEEVDTVAEGSVFMERCSFMI